MWMSKKKEGKTRQQLGTRQEVLSIIIAGVPNYRLQNEVEVNFCFSYGRGLCPRGSRAPRSEGMHNGQYGIYSLYPRSLLIC